MLFHLHDLRGVLLLVHLSGSSLCCDRVLVPFSVLSRIIRDVLLWSLGSSFVMLSESFSSGVCSEGGLPATVALSDAH